MIDLHIHSKYSDDGEYEPAELVKQCFDEKINIMSVTDHNCVKANMEAQSTAKEKGIIYIPGIEIDCVYNDINFHILGYGIDFESNDFEQIEKNIKEQNKQASFKRLANTQAMGFDVTEYDMRAMTKGRYWSETWTGEMFAEFLLSKPEYLEHPLLKPYRVGESRSDNPYVNFYWDYYAQGKLCYAKMNYPSVKEIIDIIHNNNGMAVLAHPGVNLKGSEYMFDEIIELGIDGVEVFSTYHSQEQANYFYNKTKEHNLFCTCGSDFHGKIKPAINLGKHGCFLSEKEMQQQLEKIIG